MKIYLLDGSRATRTVYVQPGKDREDNSEWFARDRHGEIVLDANGKKTAILFPVKFADGRAEVPSHLGNYMVDEGLAQKTQLALPKSPSIVVDDRVRPARRVYENLA